MRRALASIIGTVSTVAALADGPALPKEPPPSSPTITPAAKEPGPFVVPTVTLSPIEALRQERAKLAAEREAPVKESGDDATTIERRLLRKKLEELLEKMNKAPAPKKSDVPTKDPGHASVVPKINTAGMKPAEIVANATALYRNGEFANALETYKQIDPAFLTSEDLAFVKYMMAGCQRRLGQVAEAAKLYREVANPEAGRGDAFYAECAAWQLGSMNWRQDLQKQLDELSKRREAIPPK